MLYQAVSGSFDLGVSGICVNKLVPDVGRFQQMDFSYHHCHAGVRN